MAIFNSYVSLPEGIVIIIRTNHIAAGYVKGCQPDPEVDTQKKRWESELVAGLEVQFQLYPQVN